MNVTNSQTEQTQNISQASSNLKEETTKKTENLAEASFWLSLVGLLLSLFGYAFGIVIYVLVFSFAIQGLKTRKRGKAIAAIVLASVSIFIAIIWFLVAFISNL